MTRAEVSENGEVTAGPWPSRVAGALQIAQAVLLLAALPVLALMFLGSLWEGGDPQLKQRIIAWALPAGAGNVAGIALFTAAASDVLRRRPGQRTLARACAVLQGVLAAGWVWVFQGELVSDRATLGPWLLMTLPGLVGCAITLRAGPKT